MATLLMTVNVALMYAFVLTPLAVVNEYVFAVPLVGVLVYGAALMLGELVAEKGVKSGSMGLALAGVALLQLAFGTLVPGSSPLFRVTCRSRRSASRASSPSSSPS